MNRLLFVGAVVLATATSSLAQSTDTYTFSGLSIDDVLTIGRALDKLPREETDRNRLYDRLQQQITAHNQAAAKAQADAYKAALDKAAAEKVEADKKAEAEKAAVPTVPADKEDQP